MPPAPLPAPEIELVENSQANNVDIEQVPVEKTTKVSPLKVGEAPEAEIETQEEKPFSCSDFLKETFVD